MANSNRTRQAHWSTKALTSKDKERVFAACSVEVFAGRDKGVVTAASGRSLSIGTAPANDLILTDAAVSRHHCVVEATDEGFLIRDLGSTNGTRLGGNRIKVAYLEDAAVISVGETSLRFGVSQDETRVEALSADAAFGEVLGSSAVMRHIFALVERVAPTTANVLITGETGTGKGAMAKAIHQQGNRRDAPFVVVDCGAIPDSLIESELFGHERGAFTGAVSQRIGTFERAQGGTIFLDEVGELGIDMQPKLLRALENRKIRRVGGTETIDVDTRVIAATNRDLREEVNRGTFRADLYYRLDVIGLEMPPLRTRRSDIPMLVEHFYRELSDDPEAAAPAELITRCMRQNLPGNVRELRTFVQRSLVLGELDDELTNIASPNHVLDFTVPFREAKEAIIRSWEARYVPELLDRYDGNMSRAARAVSMDRNHLRKLLKNIKLDTESH